MIRIFNKTFLLFASLSLITISSQAQDKPNQTLDSSEMIMEKSDSSRFYSKASIQILNKTTAKASVEEIAIGSSLKIGKLTIFIHKCWQAPLDQKPDSKILLKVTEEQQNEKNNSIENKTIFYGWMIASSPSISSLEHPVFDIVALSCKK